MVDADSVGVLVVKERAGMAVGAATLITSVQGQRMKNKGRGGGKGMGGGTQGEKKGD